MEGEGTRAGGYLESDLLWFLDGVAGQDQRLRRVPILNLPFRMGRLPGQDLTLSAQMVSGRHAVLFLREGRLWIRDLGSTNGTYVNGERLEMAVALNVGDIIHLAKLEFRLGQADTGEAAQVLTQTIAVGADLPELVVDSSRVLEEMMRRRSVGVAFQPIVDMHGGRRLGFEVLGRGDMSGTSVASVELFKAAHVLGAEAELSQLLREQSVEDCLALPAGSVLFINTQPAEIGSRNFTESIVAFREETPELDIVVEVHEAAVTDPAQVKDMQSFFRGLGMRLAYDDFGAGQARLLELAEVPPDFLKFDLSLIRGLGEASRGRRKVAAGLVRLAADLGIQTVAEGIETEAEAEACRETGFDFGQGYLFGRPAPIDELDGPGRP